MLAPPHGSTGRRLFDAALAGGNRALGLSAPGIAPGAPADLVALDAASPALALAKDDVLLDAWIFAGAPIASVWRGGRRIVADGRHVARAALAGRYRQALAGLG